MQIEITKNGINFESRHTNIEVAQEFRKLVEGGQLTGEFPESLYTAGKKYKRYTPGQIPWLHVLVAQHEGVQTKPSTSPTLTGLGLIHAHLTNCRTSRETGGKGLLNPMVGLLVGNQNVVLKLAGPKSRNNGKVSVAEDHRYGVGQFYGWIDNNGNFTTRNPPPQTVINILKRVTQDPARVISEIGKESGRCCYCFAQLTTVQSKIAGAGKRCTLNYSVNYPNAEETRRILTNTPEILEGASDREKWE